MSETVKDYSISALLDVMQALRDKDTGCPWDLEQDFASIAPYTIEEAYEVADAIERGDMDNLKEELGDLLLQVVFHARMAEEQDIFDFHDVARTVTEKMIYRHPHVFGDQNARTASDVNQLWEERKDAEKNNTNSEHSSILDDVPRALPALLRAEKLQKKAAKVGFEWPDIEGVLDKIEEEVFEMRAALSSGEQKHIEEEYGDLLFVLVNYGRMMGIRAESTLEKANLKFYNRFSGMEKEFKAKDQNMSDASLDQLEQEWVRQKSRA